jgi:hypothetical protein
VKTARMANKTILNQNLGKLNHNTARLNQNEGKLNLFDTEKKSSREMNKTPTFLNIFKQKPYIFEPKLYQNRYGNSTKTA